MISNIFRGVLFFPVFYWIYLILWGDLGADPAKSLNHKTGQIVLYYILLNLFIGVLISLKFKGLKHLRFLISNRRFLGVLSFVILIFHVGFYLVMESFEFKAFEQMYTKTYLICASLAFMILFVLAITSNNFSVKFLGGKKWKLLHRSVYVASLFFSIHILLIEKTDLVKYGLILGSLWTIQFYRVIHIYSLNRKKSS